MEIQKDINFRDRFLEIYSTVKAKYKEKRAFDKNYDSLRIESIDFIRGIMVIITIFLICQGLETNIDKIFMISNWNGISVADIVLPFFLLIMGMSVPFYIKKHHQDGRLVAEIAKKVVLRSLILFVIGVVYSIVFLNSKSQVRLTGPYQLIAINYLICTLIYLGFLKIKVKNNALTYIFIGLGTFITAIFTVIAFKNGFKMENNIFYLIDKSVLKGFSSSSPSDSEGVLACFAAIPLTMYGLAIGCILNKKPVENKKYIRYRRPHKLMKDGFSKENLKDDFKNFFTVKSIKSLFSNYYRLNNEAKKIANLLLLGIIFYVCSKVMQIWIPLNRNVFSITFVMRTASYMFFIENICYILFDIIKLEFGTALIKRIGQNALLVILGISIINGLINLIKIKSIYTGKWMNLNNWFTTDFILPIFGMDRASSAYALAMTVFWVLVLNLLEKYDIKIGV